MHPLLAAAIVAAHHAPASPHTARYWVTGIVISLIAGVIIAVVSRIARAVA